MAKKKAATSVKKKSAAKVANKPKAAAVKKTAAVKKATAVKKTTNPRSKKATAASVNDDMRLRMISEAAYYRAQQRSFSSGADMEDWFAAEREIDAMLGRLVK